MTPNGPEREQRPWNGSGLPPAAAERIARSRRSGLATSLLSVGGGVSLESVGFVPVGEVMGSAVVQIGFTGTANCGWYGGIGSLSGAFGSGFATTITSRQSRYAAYAPYVSAVEGGYRTAIERMLAEARGLGAHGVVGVQLTETRRDMAFREFMAIGTAVRGVVRPAAAVPARPFSTQLSGSDVTRALRSGWVPVSIEVALSIGIRHEDYATRLALTSWQNTEIDAYAELVTAVRHEARDVFGQRVAASGATRAYVTDMNLRIWSVEPSPGHRDHVAESVVIGGGLIDFGQRHRAPAQPSTVTVMSLQGAGRLR